MSVLDETKHGNISSCLTQHLLKNVLSYNTFKIGWIVSQSIFFRNNFLLGTKQLKFKNKNRKSVTIICN